MVGFKNRYMVMEVFLNPNRDRKGDDPIIITQFNVSKAIKDSILVNFGECGLASSLGSFLVKYVNPITNMCIIRASREDYQKVWSAITMVRAIGNCPVIFNLLDLSVYPSPASASIFQQPSDIPVASYHWQVCGVLFAGGQFLPCCYWSSCYMTKAFLGLAALHHSPGSTSLIVNQFIYTRTCAEPKTQFLSIILSFRMNYEASYKVGIEIFGGKLVHRNLTHGIVGVAWTVFLIFR